ncbi:MAG TPA: PRC-barrel domain-containing protein [Candidatus Dormibacteraeota bacterium]|jgi:uncharacterized protein YrrD|nr:PRC-barrel domain-containing protein [Candidatus Dormibacteraeota bacterium]
MNQIGPEETPVSWRAVTAHCPVIASDGTEVGHVQDVAALPEEDIFHGIVFKHHLLGKSVLAPQSDIQTITDRAVYLSTYAAAAGLYEPFHEEQIERLGVVGHFLWKHMGWKDSKE